MATASTQDTLDFLHQTDSSMLSNRHKAGTNTPAPLHEEGTMDWPLKPPGT